MRTRTAARSSAREHLRALLRTVVLDQTEGRAFGSTDDDERITMYDNPNSLDRDSSARIIARKIIEHRDQFYPHLRRVPGLEHFLDDFAMRDAVEQALRDVPTDPAIDTEPECCS